MEEFDREKALKKKGEVNYKLHAEKIINSQVINKASCEEKK